jgi:hypothetical protein
MTWNEAQEWEREWHGTCQNTYGEEEKQLVYAEKMGLKTFHNGKSPYNFTITGNILDVGGGCVSMLLKCPNAKGTIVDPCSFPAWVYERYALAGIKYEKMAAEDMVYENEFDEVLIYNVLQHVIDPERVVHNALRAGKLVRIFEWLEVGISLGHPHNLAEDKLNLWLKGYGRTENISRSGCIGLCYYGIFKGNHYE